MPRTRQASRCSSSRIGTRASRVMSAGVWSFDPAPPLVIHTVTISLPDRAHLASVPPTVNSWSSGCAWMLIAQAGAAGSTAVLRRRAPRSGMPGLVSALSSATGHAPELAEDVWIVRLEPVAEVPSQELRGRRPRPALEDEV